MKKMLMLLLLTAFAVSMSVHRNKINNYDWYAEDAEMAEPQVYVGPVERPVPQVEVPAYYGTANFAEGFSTI